MEAIRKKKHIITIVEEYVLYSVVDDSDITQKLELEKKIQSIDKALEEMGEPCKSIIELFYFQKLNWKQISQHLNYKNADTVKNIKYKCIQKLKTIFDREG